VLVSFIANRALRRKFVPKIGQAVGDWRKLRKDELQNFAHTYLIVWLINENKMAEIGAAVWEKNLNEREYLQDVTIDV
jgi:hypothetical protein